MNYIYDIYLNLNSTLFDFFDWNKNDKLIHIKKIPIFRISEENLKKCVHNSIKVNENFINCVYNKTEVWNKDNSLSYCALLTDHNNILAIEFNEDGISIRKSFLSVEEELEILETVNRLRETNIDFEIIKRNNPIFKTRKQIKEENFVDRELKNIDIQKLDYIYFECFGKHEENKKVILNSIKKLPKNSKTYKNLYDILKLTSTSKK
ncbi:MAG: DUF3603 family protein [Bacilli bacterium]|nr:DUF3603 family protein [Bacilli bacterium]